MPCFGDQNHLAGLYAGLAVARHHIGLDHDRLPGTERLPGTGPAGRLLLPRMGGR